MSEMIFYLETWDGKLARVPASKVEVFKKSQEEAKRRAEAGNPIVAPDEFMQRLSAHLDKLRNEE